MSKAIIEALTMRVEALEKSDKSTSMRIDAVEKTLASQFTVSDKAVAKKDDDKKEKAAPKKDDDKKEKAAAKKEKKAKADTNEAKPRRVTGYILFCNSNRNDVKTKLSLSDDKPKNTEVLTELARLWRAIDVDEKEEWNARAKAKPTIPTHLLGQNTLPPCDNDDEDNDHDDEDDDDDD